MQPGRLRQKARLATRKPNADHAGRRVSAARLSAWWRHAPASGRRGTAGDLLLERPVEVERAGVLATVTDRRGLEAGADQLAVVEVDRPHLGGADEAAVGDGRQ